MTLIACVPVSDGYLLAADSGVETDGGVLVIEPKLGFRAGIPLAWGFSGDGAMGKAFHSWMEKASLPGDWEAVRNEMAVRVASTNGQRRKLASLSGVELKPGDSRLLSVIVCGYVGQQPMMTSIDDTGGEEPDGVRPLFLGGGAVVGRIAMEALVEFGAWDSEDPVTALRRLMAVSIRMGKGLREPIRVLRVSASGVHEC